MVWEAWGQTIILVILIFALRKRLPISSYSPVYLLIIIYGIAAFGGFFIYPILDEKLIGVSAVFDLSQELQSDTLSDFIMLLIFFTLGGWVASVVWKLPKHLVAHQLVGATAGRLGKNIQIILLLIAVLSLCVLIYGMGISEIFFRTFYISSDNQISASISKSMVLPSVLIMGYLFGMSKRFFVKILCLIIFVCFFLVSFSMASRRVALVSILFFSGALIGKPDTKKYIFLLQASFLMAPLLMYTVFIFRLLPVQGLIPFFDYISLVYSIENDLLFFAPIKNFLFSFPLSGYVGNLSSIDISYFYTSINPLPGFMTDWYEINDDLHVNDATPYNAVGELLNYGKSLAYISFFLLGVYFFHLDKEIRSQFANRKHLLKAMFFLGLSFLFIVTSLQYNLRSSVRLIYYLIAIEIIYWGFGFVILSSTNTLRRSETQTRQADGAALGKPPASE